MLRSSLYAIGIRTLCVLCFFLPFATLLHAQPATVWSYKGSVLTLSETGSNVGITYQTLSEALAKSGAHVGDPLFRGQRVGNSLKGKVYRLMGIPFTPANPSDIVGAWKAASSRSQGLIILGHFKSSTNGSAAIAAVGSISAACGGRMVSSARIVEMAGEAWLMSRGRFRCRSCERETSLTAGTIFADTRKPLRMWFLAMWFVTSQKNGVSALGLQRVLGLGSYETAWTWLHKLRRAMVRGRDSRPELSRWTKSMLAARKKG